MHSFVLHSILLIIPFILIDVRIACFGPNPHKQSRLIDFTELAKLLNQ